VDETLRESGRSQRTATPGVRAVSSEDERSAVATEARSDGQGSAAPSSRRAIWTATVVVLSVQLAGLIAYSTYLYRRFDVAEDFAHNAQAWYLIGHGTLNPLDTIRVPSTPFLRDHFDLVLWPLSLLHVVTSSPLVLLIIQDVAVVAAELITMMWVIRICEERLDRGRLLVELCALVLLVGNAWWYEAVSFDIHLPPLGLPFALLAGYLLWTGRPRWALVPAACCVLFGAVVMELLAVVAVGALFTRRVRDQGGMILAGAIAIGAFIWVFIVTGSGYNQASNITAEYSYLIGSRSSSGALSLVRGAVTHPRLTLRTLGHRWHALGRPLAMGGFLGLLTPIGLLVALGVLIPAGLTSSDVYSSSAGAFQTLPVVPFVLIGTVAVLVAWAHRAHRGTRWHRDRFLVAGVAVLVAVVALVQDGRLVAGIRSTWWKVTPGASSALGKVLDETPPTTEVIASNGIVGRFSQRRFVYSLAFAPQTFPVESDRVVFVITPRQGNEAMLPVFSLNDLAYIRGAIRTRTLLDRDGVVALEWTPPPGTKSLTLTGAA
jgi:uncharacterized membrane protein